MATGIDRLATDDLYRLPDAALAEPTLARRQLLDRLDGHWLQRLAAVDGRDAARAEADLEVGSTAAWLARPTAHGGQHGQRLCPHRPSAVPRPLAHTGQALCAGELSPAHAQVLAQETRHLPDHVAAEAEPVLVATARRLDPHPGCGGPSAPRWTPWLARPMPAMPGVGAADRRCPVCVGPPPPRGRLAPKVGGVQPQLAVVDLDSLLHPTGGEAG